jgi:hypothetical protein
MELVPQLVERISQARGKRKLVELLRSVKQAHDLKIRTTGTTEQLEEALTEVVLDHHLSLDAVRTLVDEIEENGTQHIFLFRLTDAGQAALTARRLANAFAAPSANVTAGFYGETPRRHAVFIGDRPGQLIVKEVHTGSFWELDEDASEDGPTRRVRVTVLRQRRAINMLRIMPESGDVEIRIDRLRGANDKKIALAGLDQFVTRLGVLNLEQHLQPVDIRPAFPAIVGAEDETFMLTDHARDASARQIISSRREGPRRATDIRQHPNYRLKGNQYLRDALHIYWKIDGDDDRMVFSILSAIKPDGAGGDLEYTKVYISAKVEPGDLDYVIARIRQFAP